jgi:uridine kinase
MPIYSFEKHAREDRTTSIYSPHVLILEGIFALYDPRVLDLLDLRIFAEADGDLCLSRRSKLKECLLVMLILINSRSRC